MGKNLIQQARGKGGPTYRAPSFKYRGSIKLSKITEDPIVGQITDIITCRGHSSPLIRVKYETGEKILMNAPEGVRIGDQIQSGDIQDINPGNVIPLKSIPEGTPIYCIESSPGDGGKFVRSSGGFARITNKMGNKVTIKFRSNKLKSFHPECRAVIGVIAGGGRTEKPILKAGTKYFMKKAKNKLWPKVSGVAMNAVDHPFGGSSSSNKGRPTQSSRNAPPGRKVGSIAPRRSGYKR